MTLNALGGSQDKPFSSTRDGEIVHVVYPTHVNDGDLLGSIMTVLASQLPTVVLHEGTSGWSEPEWTAESRAHLSGMIAAIRDVPKSFSHTTSPSDLVRVSMWVTACSSALSVPGGVKDAHGAVLPTSVASGKSASKYMTKVVQGLRSNVSDEMMIKAIDTLVTLIKLWQKQVHNDALAIVRNCKIAWSTLMFKGAPTQTIKGKKKEPDRLVIKSPVKPSKSPWLSSAERSELGNIYKDKWSYMDVIRTEWVALIPEQQHRQYEHFIKRIKQHYEELNNISNSVHAKLGKRKHWIESYCANDNYKPKPKRGESESFLLAAHFFSKDHASATLQMCKLFAPLTYFPDRDNKQNEIWHSLFPEKGVYEVTSGTFSLKEEGESFKLWAIWADIFKPKISNESDDPAEPQPTKDTNLFKVLFGFSQT